MNLIKKLLPSLLSALLAIFLYRFFFEEHSFFNINRPSNNPSAIWEKSRRETLPPLPIKPYPEAEESRMSFHSDGNESFRLAAAQSRPAVVHIKTFLYTSTGWFHGKKTEEETGKGSGVLISQDGYIATNYHVIEGADRIEIALNDKRRFDAQVIGYDKNTDLALLKVKADSLPYLRFANSDSLQVGDWVLAVGNPFNLSSTVTLGIVSAKARNIDILDGSYSVESFIQTDAAVNPGNSGGALVNAAGELVGINTAILTRSGQYEGYSFAIPSNLVRKVIYDLREYGSVQRGILGVSISEVLPETAKELDLPGLSGVLITSVSENSAAEEAGLKEGDVIVSIAGKSINSIPELQELIARQRPGDVIDLEYYREGVKQRTTVVLKNRFGEQTPQPSQYLQAVQRSGLELRDLKEEEVLRLKVRGAYVVSVRQDSPAAAAHLEPGYVITHINKTRVRAAEQAVKIFLETEGSVILRGYYARDGHPAEEYFYQFDLF